jgi:hypothetical protein
MIWADEEEQEHPNKFQFHRMQIKTQNQQMKLWKGTFASSHIWERLWQQLCTFDQYMTLHTKRFYHIFNTDFACIKTYQRDAYPQINMFGHGAQNQNITSNLRQKSVQ